MKFYIIFTWGRGLMKMTGVIGAAFVSFECFVFNLTEHSVGDGGNGGC